MSWEITRTGCVHHPETFDSECGGFQSAYIDWPSPEGSGWEPFDQEGGVVYWRRNTTPAPIDPQVQQVTQRAMALLKALGMGPNLSNDVRKAVLDLYGVL